MRKIVVWVVLVSLVLSGTAWAQAQEPVVLNACGVYTIQEWLQLPDDVRAITLGCWSEADVDRAKAEMAKPVKRATTVKTGEWVSPGAVLTGLLTSLAGLGVAFHSGRDEYRILGDTYCVGDYTVDYGNCNSPLETQIGLGMMGAGALLMFIGSRSKTRKVAVAPILSKTVAGASVKMVW